MAIELITGRAGTPHVDSADVGAMNAALFGSDVYILVGLSAELVDANNVRIHAGEILAEGRHIRITGSGETLAISNGLSNYNRNDIIAAKYLRDGSGIETVSLIVVKGSNASGTPADPAMPTSGKLIDGASEVYWPLYRITVNGLTPQAPVMVASSWAAYVGADAIIAEGVTSNVADQQMRWIKYANGFGVIYGTMKSNPYPLQASNFTQQGNLYKADYVTISYPFSFVEVPKIVTTVQRDANELIAVRPISWTGHTTRLIAFSTHASSNVYSTVHFVVAGMWK